LRCVSSKGRNVSREGVRANMHKKPIYPGTPEFRELLIEFHRETGAELDKKVRSGIHEPGHGAAHMEMALFFYHELADLAQLTEEQRELGALAVILHDIWRENIYVSHTIKCAEMAAVKLVESPVLESLNVEIPDHFRDLVVKFVASHSMRSVREKDQNIPEEWLLTLKVLQVADILANMGAFGYLRSFSYSGHVLKSMLGQIRAVVKDPKKYQDPLPENLRLFLSTSDNYFHEWILSIMLKTNRNYIDKTSDKVMMKFARNIIEIGIKPDIISKITGLTINDKKEEGDINGSLNFINIQAHPIISQIMTLLNDAKSYVVFFSDFIHDLDRLAHYGLENESAGSDVENDIIRLLEYSILGMCSRAFWGQFNPKKKNTGDNKSDEYMTLYERIIKFSNMMSKIKDDSHKAGIKTEEGKKIFRKINLLSHALIKGAKEQYANHRWTIDMWGV
jgi:hypothetical protein